MGAGVAAAESVAAGDAALVGDAVGCWGGVGFGVAVVRPLGVEAALDGAALDRLAPGEGVGAAITNGATVKVTRAALIAMAGASRDRDWMDIGGSFLVERCVHRAGVRRPRIG